MELWIRSQDKYTLIKAKNIQIIETKGLKEKLENSILSCLKDMEQVKSYLKDGYSILVDEINVGVYNTKERALEVLDEIQNILKPIIHYEPITREKIDYTKPYVQTEQIGSKSVIQELSTYVYEMPKE